MKDATFKMRPCTRKDLAALYRCSPRTMYRWLNRIEKEIGPRIGYLYYPKQVRIIVQHLGEPDGGGV